ncbi:hypothetical protein M231_01256 [Tremella mesenterica]|uniref:EF-hand domain-containing protein n=1 Tax=Tremella mesenterica TaxID=5217 RepID=A0A4Q1BTF2_TREME|nr:hypothetical protein M231_01256 [Tremella mesenterica]
MSKPLLSLALLSLVFAHSEHSFDLDDAADAGMSYAERHMHTEHHIDSFDLPSFFKLHDLDSDGYWDQKEIAAVYGLYHHKVKDKVPETEEHKAKVEEIVNVVLQRLDTDRNGKISLVEYIAGGNDGLPNFPGYKDLGHHYDEESEYFLHHEELYHSTPETQTDESYVHPEDHIHIEAEEDARERIFEGLPPDANLEMDHVASDPLDEHAHAQGEGPSDVPLQPDPEKDLKPGDEIPPPPKIQRVTPGASPARLGREGEEKLYKPDEGHGRGREAGDRLPYKSRFRKGLRTDEF